MKTRIVMITLAVIMLTGPISAVMLMASQHVPWGFGVLGFTFIIVAVYSSIFGDIIRKAINY